MLQSSSSSSEGEGFSVGSGGKMGVDPRLPNVKQMGVWSESESMFPNWPHNHHPEESQSAKNLRENLKLVEELEDHIEAKRRQQKLKSMQEPEDQKQIKP